MALVQPSDWEVTEKHAEIIRRNSPVPLRTMHVRKSIPGVKGRRISAGLTSGLWLKPLGEAPGKTFGCLQDIAHSTLVIYAQSSTTAQATGTPDYDKLRAKIIRLFHNRRATRMNGEIYSRVDVGDYDIDDALAREMDVDVYEITSWFREDRDEWVS